MKNVFIVNPKAGKRNAAKKLTEAVRACLERRREAYEIYTTVAPGDGTRAARDYADTGEEMRIFACGGDGSAFEVLNGVVGRENVALGVIPCGTGNDFLKTFHGAEHFASVEDQLAGTLCRLDGIKAGDLYCMNQASMGMDAQVCVHKDKFSRLPLVGGKVAYVMSLFYCFFSAIQNHLTVQLDDGRPREEDFLFAIAANGQYYGGGFMSAPLALPNDGLLDCVTVNTVSRPRIVSLLKKYTRGEHLSYDFCRCSKGKRLTVTAEKPTPVNLDGEVIFTRSITFEAAPGLVRFILPRGAGLPAAGERQAPAAMQSI